MIFEGGVFLSMRILKKNCCHSQITQDTLSDSDFYTNIQHILIGTELKKRYA